MKRIKMMKKNEEKKLNKNDEDDQKNENLNKQTSKMEPRSKRTSYTN